jgi:hypothetical protein
VAALPVYRERWKGWETALEILSGILYWLLVWFLAGIPASLVLAQLLKAASEQLEREESERLLGIRRFRPNEGLRNPIRRSAPTPRNGRAMA